MNEAVRETICTDCKNRDICKYCEDIIKAERKASEINSTLNVLCPASVKVVCERRKAIRDLVNRYCLDDADAAWEYGIDLEEWEREEREEEAKVAEAIADSVLLARIVIFASIARISSKLKGDIK